MYYFFVSIPLVFCLVMIAWYLTRGREVADIQGRLDRYGR
jgi:hypothetical protein